jgi:hypothetical protein
MTLEYQSTSGEGGCVVNAVKSGVANAVQSSVADAVDSDSSLVLLSQNTHPKRKRKQQRVENSDLNEVHSSQDEWRETAREVSNTEDSDLETIANEPKKIVKRKRKSQSIVTVGPASCKPICHHYPICSSLIHC